MLQRSLALTALLLAGWSAPILAQDGQPDFGLSTPILVDGNQIIATYVGWDPATVYGHQIYALTLGQYAANLANTCFDFYAADRTSCSGASSLEGIDLFGKPNGVTCPVADINIDPCLASEVTQTFNWDPDTEIIFALMVDQGNGDTNWFFSGDPTRNAATDGDGVGYAHLALFAPASYPDGVPSDNGNIVPNTVGRDIYGFEDVSYTSSDWDFNDALFTFEANTVGVPQSSTPEPAALTLLATGLAALAATRRRRQRGRLPAA
ncbi:MAG TPA: VPLPA-CTERM sorting domain-containing protein [Gemmatimonadales bacterium]|jgi:hypothetical protein